MKFLFKKGHKINNGRKASAETRRKMSLAHKGKNIWSKGRKLSEAHKKKVSDALKGRMPKNINDIKGWNKGLPGMKGKDNPAWKGDDVGYLGLHRWVNLKLGTPDTCEHCGKSGLKGKQIHWANKDHSYKRNLKDWLRLCASCHKKYDIKHGNI